MARDGTYNRSTKRLNRAEAKAMTFYRPTRYARPWRFQWARLPAYGWLLIGLVIGHLSAIFLYAR